MLSHVWLFATPWTIAHQAPLSMGFPRQEYWSGLPLPSPGDLPHPGMEPEPPALAGGHRSKHFITGFGQFWLYFLSSLFTLSLFSLYDFLSLNINMMPFSVKQTHKVWTNSQGIRDSAVPPPVAYLKRNQETQTMILSKQFGSEPFPDWWDVDVATTHSNHQKPEVGERPCSPKSGISTTHWSWEVHTTQLQTWNKYKDRCKETPRLVVPLSSLWLQFMCVNNGAPNEVI